MPPPFPVWPKAKEASDDIAALPPRASKTRDEAFSPADAASRDGEK